MAKKNDNTLLVIAIVLVAVSAVTLIVTWSSVFAASQVLLQPVAPEEGEARVLIASEAAIRFSHNIVDWGSGFVTPGQTAVLDTEGTLTEFNGGSVVNFGLVAENSGNVPIAVDIEADQDATTFLDGATSPQFQYSVQNCFFSGGYDCLAGASQSPGRLQDTDDNAVACSVSAQDPNSVGMWAGYVDMPITPSQDRICGNTATDLGMEDGALNDEIELNIRLAFDDAITTGQKSAIITLTATDVTL